MALPLTEDFKYGIKERRTDGYGCGLAFAWFMFRDDRDTALKAIRAAEGGNSQFVKLVPVRRKGAE